MRGDGVPRKAGESSVSRRVRFAAVWGRLAGRLSRSLGRGSGGTIVGRVVVALAPRALTELTAGRFVVLVSGTNGKTTTTAFTVAALRAIGPVTTNADGDNLPAGLVSALVQDRGQPGSRLVLEVDEIVLPRAIELTSPSVLVLLNLSRDQLDRTGEVMGHVRRWSQALLGAPSAVVVANADDPLVAALVSSARPTHERVVWVAGGHSWLGDALLCASCGGPLTHDASYSCRQCGFSRPSPDWTVEPTGLRHVGANTAALPLQLALPGRANEANAAMAVAAATVAGVEPRLAIQAISAITAVSGRYLRATVAGHEVQFFLAKNPAGWAELLDVLAHRDTAVIISINARDADGTDPSWLWDAPFERLRGRRVFAIGDRRSDLAVRLTYGEVEHALADDATDALKQIAESRCDVVANYTAFKDTQRQLVGGPERSKRSA
jgi:UDP-N-acetylmuramyl tripeptide synthase